MCRGAQLYIYEAWFYDDAYVYSTWGYVRGSRFETGRRHALFQAMPFERRLTPVPEANLETFTRNNENAHTICDCITLDQMYATPFSERASERPLERILYWSWFSHDNVESQYMARHLSLEKKEVNRIIQSVTELKCGNIT